MKCLGSLKSAYLRDKNIIVELSVKDLDAIEPLQELASCESLDIELKKHREKRSLNANAYFHVLCSKIAKVNQCSMYESKNILIARYGEYEKINGSILSVPLSDDINAYKIESIHLQPTSKTTMNHDGKVFRIHLVMRGSHTYNTKEMARLIEGTIDEAKSLDIKTITPAEQERMLQLWKV